MAGRTSTSTARHGRSCGTWGSKTIKTAPWTEIDIASTSYNTLRLIVTGATALFYVNDRYVATLDVSEKQVAGGVKIGTSFITGDYIAGRSTRYEGFSVATIEP